MLRRLSTCFVLCASSTLLVGQSGQSTIRGGETLKVTVYKEPELTRFLTVQSDGNVRIPVIGDVKAEGLTLADFSRQVESELSRIINNPQVTTERAEPAK